MLIVNQQLLADGDRSDGDSVVRSHTSPLAETVESGDRNTREAT